MKKRSQIILGVVLVIVFLVAAGGALFWYSMGEPLYRPGMVRAGQNLRSPLAPPAQSGGSDFWSVEPDIQLYHYTQGVGSDVLIIHGGPGYPYVKPWTALDHVAGFRFNYYDQRGAGRSSRPIDTFASSNFYENVTTLDRTYGIGAQIADIERIRQILGQDRLILIGHSWGGFLASLYAAEFPEHVRALVLVAPAEMLVMPQASGGLFEEVKQMLPGTMQAEYADFQSRYLGFGNLFSKSEADLVALNDEFGKYYAAASGESLPDQGRSGGWMVWAMYMSLGTRHDYRASLVAVAAPVLVIHGAQDLQSEKESRAYSDLFPNSKFEVIQGTGHFPFYDKPDQFAALLTHFLTGLK